MRPIRLELRGFTAFRERTVVDFEGRQLFAITGPTGAGRMTGRAAGYCAGHSVPGFANPVLGYGRGRGLGRGFGRGFGMGWGRGGRRASFGGLDLPAPAPMAPISRDEELSALKEQAAHLEQLLRDTANRIEGLESNEE